MEIFSFLQYTFIQKAFVAGAFTAMLCAALGIFLVLRKMSMIGDGLSHVSFGAVAIGLLFGVYPLYVAVPVAVLGAYFINYLVHKTKLYGDASISIVSAVGVSSGVIIASLAHGFNVDLFSYLFGSILAISTFEALSAVVLSLIVLLVVWLFYNDLFSTTYEEEYARISGIKVERINNLLLSLTAVSVVLAVKVVGVMLVSALLVLPAVTALQIGKSFKSSLVLAVLLSVLAVIIGITLSFFWDLPSGATIVMVLFGFFLLTLLEKKVVK